jgi:hypothetical protein
MRAFTEPLWCRGTAIGTKEDGTRLGHTFSGRFSDYPWRKDEQKNTNKDISGNYSFGERNVRRAIYCLTSAKGPSEGRFEGTQGVAWNPDTTLCYSGQRPVKGNRRRNIPAM